MVNSGPTKHIHAYILNAWLDVSCTGLDYKVFALIRHLLTRSLKFVYYILFLFNFVNFCFLFAFVCFCLLFFLQRMRHYQHAAWLKCYEIRSRLLRQAKCLHFPTLYCSIFVPPSFFNPLFRPFHTLPHTLSALASILFSSHAQKNRKLKKRSYIKRFATDRTFK